MLSQPRLPASADRGTLVYATGSLPSATFVPQCYEPQYAYPLLVLLHGRGGNEQQLIRLVPQVSQRNFVAIGLRGPIPRSPASGRSPGFCWSDPEDRLIGPESPLTRSVPFQLTPSVRSSGPASPSALISAGSATPHETIDEFIDDYVFQSIVQARRQYHIHSERIFLVGVGEGAAVAYRLGFTYPDRFAGVAALGGWPPRRPHPLLRLPHSRSLRVFLAHGRDDRQVPVERSIELHRVLYAAGLAVSLAVYPWGHQLMPGMLADLNQWVMSLLVGN